MNADPIVGSYVHLLVIPDSPRGFVVSSEVSPFRVPVIACGVGPDGDFLFLLRHLGEMRQVSWRDAQLCTEGDPRPGAECSWCHQNDSEGTA